MLLVVLTSNCSVADNLGVAVSRATPIPHFVWLGNFEEGDLVSGMTGGIGEMELRACKCATYMEVVL